MSRLMVDVIISLDGYAAADGWPGFWGLEGPEYLAWLEEETGHEHRVLTGATTYRLMSGFAESGEAGLSGLTAMPKVVFSSTLEAPLSWGNTELVVQDPVQAVQAMKQDASAPPMSTIGFDEYPDVALELVTSRTFDGRLQLLEYVPTVLDGPPDAEAAPS